MKSQVFNTLPSISIDYGIMEKSESISYPSFFQWNDIGSWLALEKYSLRINQNYHWPQF